MNDRQLIRLSIVTGFAAIVLLAVTTIAHADVRTWDDIINEETCTVTGSGSRTTVHVDGQQVAELSKGETWSDDGPVTGEVRVWLQRDLYDSQAFVFDCTEVPPSTTTTIFPTTTTTIPSSSTTIPTSTTVPTTTTAAPTTTIQATTTTQTPGTSSTAPPTTAPSSTSTLVTTTIPDGSSVPPSTTTEDPCGPNTLPCTGPTTDPLAWAFVGAALLIIGAAALRAEQVTRRERKQ